MLFPVITNKRNIFVKRFIYISHHHSWAADVTGKKASHFHLNLYININLYHERYLNKTNFIENQKKNYKDEYHFILVLNYCNTIESIELEYYSSILNTIWYTQTLLSNNKYLATYTNINTKRTHK